MRTLGLIGGMSWESTAIYYRHLNDRPVRAWGVAFRQARFVLAHFEIAECQHQGDWGGATVMMIDAACGLQRAGAEAIVICTNTMHLMADQRRHLVSLDNL